MKPPFPNRAIAKTARRIVAFLCGGLLALMAEPMLPASMGQAHALPPPAKAAAPTSGAGVIGSLQEAAPEWLGKAQHLSKEVLVDLLVSKSQLARQVADRLDEGYALPYAEEVRLCLRDQRVMLEYRF